MRGSGPVLIAYDGSPGARAAAAEAGRLFGGRRAIIVTVWSTVTDAAAAALLALPAGLAHDAAAAIDRESREQAERLGREGAALAEEAGLEARAEAAQAAGNVWSTIATIAEREDAAVLVVGSRGRSGVKSMILGSVSGSLVNNCGRPVLVVHPPA